MAKHRSYYELLKDPRWTKKRQKILKRDNFKCTACGAKHNLQVHHTYYIGNHNYPWAYPDESLITLCEECHNHYHETHEIEIRKHHVSHKPPKSPKKKVTVVLLKDQTPKQVEKYRNKLEKEANRLLGKKKKYRLR